AIHEERVAAGRKEGHRDEPATQLGERLADALPESYKEDFDAATGLRDLRRLEALSGQGDVGMQLYECHDEQDEASHRFKLYLAGEGVSLSQLLPMLQQMDVEVLDQRPYDIRMPDGSRAWIYDFGLRVDRQTLAKITDPDTEVDLGTRFQDAFRAMWDGSAEIDGLNGLVLRSGLTWRQTSVLRAYSRYLQQAGTPYSQAYIERTVLANPQVAAALIDLFELKFDVADGEEVTPERRNRVEQRAAEIESMIDSVESLDEDRILRGLLTLIKATLRTNYYRTDDNGEHRSYLSFKLEPTAVPDLPEPRPRFEIFVCSPRVEGVHLRFGSVARGGLRWSDRREDYRTEILGLVKAQAVKNSVIVPVGAKGGFVVKNPPAPTGDPAADREALQAEGIACYRMFISGLLDLTDNRRDGKTVPAPQVVRYDDDDSYLVVAADKGTATFSDIANEVSLAYGHWLGDAFASGGSAGYDHKEMGITARGAWESVKRHFRELGIDTQTQDFTVVGIGDMSGDVFGNGMLLSEHIRLVAAFNHMHIFVDPNPDAATSYAERRRLFELPRSSWADYNTELMSAGGGIFPRTAKSVPVSPQMREVLGLDEGITKMTPPELIRAVLKAPVDLLWNGGIGTYVKASTESNADVGDKGNDPIRVDGKDLRVRVIGEGGNLGMTQLGRIEAALHGIKNNTDAIDNSAGVDTSDHEVNIKILLNGLVADGDMTVKQRNKLLAEMTDEVGTMVLRSNYAQNTAIANALAQSKDMLHAQQRFLKHLVREGHLDRALEFLPTDRQIRERLAAGQGLSGPETAVLLAYTKFTVAEELLHTSLPDDPYLKVLLHAYFPTALRERFLDRIDTHPLRREITTTVLVNDTVNTGGTTYLH